MLPSSVGDEGNRNSGLFSTGPPNDSSSASMANATGIARVLVIIFGAYRTFDRTCESIVQNIIAPNAPYLRVILSVDEEKPLLLSEQTGDCLAPFAESLVILADREVRRKGRAPAEFTLIDRALSYTKLLNETYDFMIKVRTDLQANVAIPPMTHIYGDANMDSGEAFLRFERARISLYSSKLNRSPTSIEIARAYVLSAGIPEFLEPMLFRPSPSPWSMGDHEFLRINLEDTFRRLQAERMSLLETLRKVHQLHQVAYLIGCTWLNFGRYQIMEAVSLNLTSQFGKLTWGEYGFDDTEGKKVPGFVREFEGKKLDGFVMKQKWRRVTESQMRLAHKKLNVELVDLINIRDYEKTFNISDTSRHSLDNKDPALLFYILRDCTRAGVRAECKLYRSGRQPLVDIDMQRRRSECDRIKEDFHVIPGRSLGSATERVIRLWMLVFRCDNLT